jgi:small subunit ribosomal protein S13
MSSFLNKQVNEKSPVKQVLTSVFGVGPLNAALFCKDLGFSPKLSFCQLSAKQQATLADHIVRNNKFLIRDGLTRFNYDNLKRLVLMRSYRGLRHKKGLPLRGQRTRTNAKSAKKQNKGENRYL